MRPASAGQAARTVTRAQSGSRKRPTGSIGASCRVTQAPRRLKSLAGAERAAVRLLDDNRGGVDRRAHEREPAPVKHETFARLEHHVVGVAVLSDPQRPGETAHGQALTVADVEHLAGTQLARE